MSYIKYTDNDNLDVTIGTIYSQCRGYEPRGLDFYTQNIQEWCSSCSEILCFKQIVTDSTRVYTEKYIEKIKNCGLCGISIYQQEWLDEIEFKLCSDCYQTSFEWVESTLTKITIPILYLPWWDTCKQCIACEQFLKFNSNCQKLCVNCKIIYIGCRYCLTTNIIFGITDQSHCKKCKRMISIIINITNDIEDGSYIFTKINTYSNYNQIANYANKKNSFNLTIPIMFILFNNNENECYCCKKSYSIIPLPFYQKYCRYCLIIYIKYVDNANLDVLITTVDPKCRKHESRSLDFCTRNIQEWCNSCSKILCFKQIVTNNRGEDFSTRLDVKKYFEKTNNCRLCGKSINNQECLYELDYIEFRLCSDCYQPSFEWVESTLTKKVIPILYLPWWGACNQCIACDQFLEFRSNYQKLCLNCKIIYTGCRYCLTTNIIFGITDQSQCKKCKRMISIIINITNDIEDESFISTKINTYNYNQIANYINKKNSNPFKIYDCISRLYLPLKPLIDLISYFKITIIEDIEDSFNLIIPIIFIPFNNNEKECYYCKRTYSTSNTSI